MKILFLDFLYPKRHVRQNITYINCLSKIAKVYVLAPKGRYTNLSSVVEIIERDTLAIKSGKLLNRLSSLKIMFISALIANSIKPDYIFVSTYETIMFAIGRLFFSTKSKFLLLQHYNIDELESKVKRWFFKRYMKKVEHIVFEDFIKDYIIKSFKLDPKKIHLIPHQLNENFSIANKKKYSCVGLSYSNDENVISEIINTEKQKEILKKAKCKVVLKSKTQEFDNGFLKVIKKYLDDDEYNEYINNSQSIYMPFPLSFRYRMSGTLVDALSNHKVVLASNIPLIQCYASKYPEVCKIINNAEDFFSYVLNAKMIDEDKLYKDFKRFKEEHGEERIIEALKNMLK